MPNGVESEEAQSIYSVLSYNSDFYQTSRMNAAEDGLTVDRNKNLDGKRRRKDIDSVLNKKGFGRHERARAIPSLRRAKEIKQFLMSLFLSRLRAQNGTLLADIKVAVSLL